MIRYDDERYQSIPVKHRRQVEAVVERVGAIGRESLDQEPTWVVERLQQQALSLASAQYHLQRQAAELQRQQAVLASQQQQIRSLELKLNQVQRSQKRQAAPFARSAEKRQRQPKRPGRKAGHPGQWRQPPPPHPHDEHLEVPLEHCPHCEHSLEPDRHQAVEQTIVEVPVVTPRVIRLRTYRNYCQQCQCPVRSHHPLQVSTATGAAGTQLGPQAVGVASYLNKHLGLPMRKTCDVLHHLLGVSVSAGGLSQAMTRAAHRLHPRYDDLLTHLRQGESLYSDETSWWVAGNAYYLWVLTNEAGTYYRIVPSRSRETARELIGDAFEGVLVSDCLNIYDDLTPLQHKCYAHHLKAISQALHTPGAEHSRYLLDLRALLRSAMVLHSIHSTLSDATRTMVRQRLETRADTLLNQPRGDPDETQGRHEEKIRRRLSRQRDHLFTFLDVPTVEATNNAAERQLRPAVITRKVSCGNQSLSGAHTWEVLASLAATAKQHGMSFIDLVADAVSLDPHKH